MKKYLLILALVSSVVHAFEPLCLDPQDFSKRDIKNILQKNNNGYENQLIIYSVNPPMPINWKSPKSAFRSLARNSFISEGYTVQETHFDGEVMTRKQKIKTHFIGHMFLKLNCVGYPAVLTGMTSPGYEEVKGLMLQGKSFSQIISTTKGHFNSAEELQEEIDIRSEKVGNLHYMGINLKPGSCEELLKYLTEFRSCGLNQRYGGLDAQPNKGEGAGCSAFVMSFLQRLNILPMMDNMSSDQFGSEFVRTINIPKTMLKTEESKPKVGAWGLLRGNKIPWAKEGMGRKTVFFDPELFSGWIKNFTAEKNVPGLTYLGKDGNKLVNGIWFEENSKDIKPSSYSIDYLFN